jgi:hypothetical protein
MTEKNDQLCLTQKILEYQKTNENEDAVLALCSLHVYYRLKKFSLLDEDMKQEFYLSFIPYLRKIIHSFTFHGIPFEIFINYVLKRRVKSFFRSLKRHSLLWDISNDRSCAHLYKNEKSIPGAPAQEVSSIFQFTPEGVIANRGTRKKFLLWALKQSRLLNLPDISLISRYTNIPEDWLMERVEFLKKSLEKQERRLACLRGRRNRLFLQARILEMRIQRASDMEEKRDLIINLEKKHGALRNIMQRIAHIPLQPSHRLLAKVTKIPKGSIDTAMARLKHILALKYQNRLPKSA